MSAGAGDNSNDVQIPKDLREVIEDSDNEYDLGFRDPEELMKIFTELEEKNLNLIEDCQEVEQQLEAKKHECKELEGET